MFKPLLALAAAFAAMLDLLRPLLDPGRWVQLAAALGMAPGLRKATAPEARA